MAALPEKRHLPGVKNGGDTPAPSQLAGGGGGGYDGNMEQRLSMIEATMPTLSTKADLAELRADLIAEIHKISDSGLKWMIGTTIGLFIGYGGLFVGMTNALKPGPHAAPAAAQPIVIYLPQGAPALPAR